MKKLLSALLVLGSSLGYGQELTQTVKGRILDSQSKSPIIGANVIVTSLDKLTGTVTDIDGYFSIPRVPIGRHNLKISFIGYKDAWVRESLVESGKQPFLNIEITESIDQLDEVLISARRQRKGQVENEMATVSAISFDVEETSRYAATFDDPARAALSFPGVRGAGDDVNNEIVIRGNSPRGLLWRIEGIEVPNPNHFAEVGASGGGISMLSNNMLAATDFYTGAFPAEFGNALSGVFDVKLRNGNRDEREYAFEASVLGIQAAAEGPFKPGSKSSYLINYRYSTLSVFDKIGIDIVGSQETIVFQDLAFKLNFPNEELGTFIIWGFGGANDQIFENDESIGESFTENWKQRAGAAGIKHTYFFNSNTFIETSISGTGTINEWEYDSLNIRTYENENFSETSLRAQTMLNKKFSARSTLRTGVIVSNSGFDMYSFFYDRNAGVNFVTLNDNGSTVRFQGFMQWQYRPSDKWTVNMGMHGTHLGLGGQQSLEPRVGASYAITPKSKINAGMGLHSRMETVAVYLARDYNTTGTIQANKDLDFSKALHYVLGYEQSIGNSIRAKAEVYYQDLYDVPILTNDPTQPWMATYSLLNSTAGYGALDLNNGGEGRNYGVELLLEKFFSNGSYFMATGSLFESLYTPADGKEYNTRYNGNFLMNFLGGKEFKVGRDNNNLLSFNGRVIWQGGNRDIPIDLAQSQVENRTVRIWGQAYEDRLNNYFRFDFGVSYRKNKPNHSSVLSLNIQNVTGRINEAERYYSSSRGAIRSSEQMGLLPNLSYRILF